MNPETLVHYAILDFTEIVYAAQDDEQAVVEIFAWENSRLKIKRSFNTFCRKVLLRKKRQNNMPLNRVFL